jgi:drug/metabolite transporter (DMT)-like permease
VESWYAFALVSMLLNGFRAFSTKRAAQRQTPTVVARIVPTATMVALACAVLTYRVSRVRTEVPEVFVAASLQGALFYLAALARWEALRLRTPAHVLFPILQASTPLVILVSAALFNEWSDLRHPTRLTGIVLSIGATYALVDWNRLAGDRRRGMAFGVVAAVAGSGATLAAKAAFELDSGASVFMFILISNALGLTLGMVHSLINEGVRLEAVTTGQIAGGVAIGMLNFLGLAAFLQAIKFGNLAIVAAIGALSVIIPIVLSVFIDGEQLQGKRRVAVALSVLALALLA